MKVAARRSEPRFGIEKAIVLPTRRFRLPFCLLLAALLLSGLAVAPARADIPALCAPAKARHDKAMASGDRSAAIAARERIKVLAQACPQLWAAVRNAPLPRAKEEAKATQAQPKAEPKAQPRPNPANQFEEPTISQPATTYVGDGDVAHGHMRWLLWRTQEGCYFFRALGSFDFETKGLAAAKKYWIDPYSTGQFRWKGQCTPGKLINGSGTLENKRKAQFVKGFDYAQDSGTMIQGLWDGYVNQTQIPQQGSRSEYRYVMRMGCSISADGTSQFGCQPPRIPQDLMETNFGPVGLVQSSSIVLLKPGATCRWVLDGEWQDELGRRIRVAMQPGGIVLSVAGTPQPGQSQAPIMLRENKQNNWGANGNWIQAALLNGGYLSLMGLPGLTGQPTEGVIRGGNYQRVSPASPPACVAN